MDLRKLERSTALLREELTDILRSEVRDPRLHTVTVTSVRLSRDRRYARVYVDLSQQEQEEEQAILAALRRAAGFVRRCLAQRLTWYKAPEVSFHLDEGMKQGDRVLELFRDLELEGRPEDDAREAAAEEYGTATEEYGANAEDGGIAAEDGGAAAEEAGTAAEEAGTAAEEAGNEHAEEHSSR